MAKLLYLFLLCILSTSVSTFCMDYKGKNVNQTRNLLITSCGGAVAASVISMTQISGKRLITIPLILGSTGLAIYAAYKIVLKKLSTISPSDAANYWAPISSYLPSSLIEFIECKAGEIGGKDVKTLLMRIRTKYQIKKNVKSWWNKGSEALEVISDEMNDE